MASQKTANLGLNKWIGTDLVLREEFNENFDTLDARVTGRTTADVTYYVSTTGSDTTGIGTVGNPYATVTFAINKLPRNVNHTIVIKVASGTYSESIGLSGFFGSGSISIIGGTNVTDATNYRFQRIAVQGCNLAGGISISFLEFITTTDYGIYSKNVMGLGISECRVTTSSALQAIVMDTTIGSVYGCVLSNRNTAIYAQLMSTVFSNNNTGSGNVIGILATRASTIGKVGAQPGGTTPEVITEGSTIR